ncbi:MAG: tetratricopeptide repeat protein [Gemmatimonadaceae bacterium]
MDNTALLDQIDHLLPTSLPNGEALKARRDAIAGDMEGAVTPADRARIKAEIVELFRDAERALNDYAEFKKSVKALATQWKKSEPSTAPTPMFSAVTHRVDMLGASTFIEKGWSMLSLGDAVGAETALRKALELNPADNEAESLLGWAQMHQENYDSALLTFHNVLLREPQNALARTNVGYICLRKKIYGEAIEHLSRAIRLDTDRKATLYAHLYLGQVYYEREMFDDAEAFFNKALELGPNLLQAWYELGRAFWFSGQRDRALESWHSGASSNKFNPWGKRCAELLESIERGGVPPR